MVFQFSSCFSASHFLYLISFLSLFTFISSSSTTISIPITQSSKPPSQDPSQKLTYFASLSLTRARHLKNPKKAHYSTTPLSPESYGGYSISLGFGTPPQTLPFVMDTGSDLVWFPCTHNYQCKTCSYSNSKTPTAFIPKSSSSSKLIGCRNPKCNWIHTSDVNSRCQDCSPKTNCSQICPPYLVIYGSGSTGGILLSETITLAHKRIPDFVVGCSLFSSKSPTGISGLGRGPSSLPSQLRLNKFSYCLLSHRFDDGSKTSSLILETGSDSGRTNGVSYTPLLKNPVNGNSAFSVYYYVGLRKIMIGDKKVKIPYDYLSLGADGNGGTIVDSGSTFTFMESRVFELIETELINQTAHYKRAVHVEAHSGLRPCYDVSDRNTFQFPEFAFGFKGGEKLILPLENYFSFVGTSEVLCMTITTDGGVGGGGGGAEMNGGPAVILGNFQLQNYYVEFDVKNERFGFRKQTC